MEADYKRDMSHSYLVLKENGEQNMAAYQVRMLLGNGISSLLSCTAKGLNGQVLFYYEITGRQSVWSFFEKQQMERGILGWILEGILNGLLQIEEYLLNPDDLVLLPEYIYLDLDRKKLFLCYLPGYQKDITMQFRKFTEYYLPKIDHKDGRAVAVGYGIYRLVMEEGIQAEQMKEILYHGTEEEPVLKQTSEKRERKEDFDEFQRKLEQETARREAMNAFFQDDTVEEEDFEWRKIFGMFLVVVVVVAGLVAAWWLGYLQWQLAILLGIATAGTAGVKLGTEKWRHRKTQEPEEQISDTGQEMGTEIWEEYQEKVQQEKEDKKDAARENNMEEETTLLYQSEQPTVSSLVSKIPGKYPTIFLEKEMVVIGKLAVAADVILESSTISRIHARITRKDGRFYLSDLNSRNGTCVNGRILQGEEEYELQEYDEISFAEVQYVFIK